MHIKKMAQAVGVCMALLAQQAGAQQAQDSGKVELSPLNVSGEALPVEQQALEKPGAVSARGADTRLQSVDQILRGTSEITFKGRRNQNGLTLDTARISTAQP